jgi:hypothetical protein
MEQDPLPKVMTIEKILRLLNTQQPLQIMKEKRFDFYQKMLQDRLYQ